MPRKERTITEGQCTALLKDLEGVAFQMDTLIARHQDLVRNEWLGGDADANNYSAAPKEMAEAFRKITEARKLLNQADHEIAMFRALKAPYEAASLHEAMRSYSFWASNPYRSDKNDARMRADAQTLREAGVSLPYEPVERQDPPPIPKSGGAQDLPKE